MRNPISHYRLKTPIVIWLILSALALGLWPLLGMGSLFLYDNPQNMTTTTMMFVGINLYPVYVVGLIWASCKLYAHRPLLSWIIGGIPLVFALFMIFYLMR